MCEGTVAKPTRSGRKPGPKRSSRNSGVCADLPSVEGQRQRENRGNSRSGFAAKASLPEPWRPGGRGWEAGTAQHGLHVKTGEHEGEGKASRGLGDTNPLSLSGREKGVGHSDGRRPSRRRAAAGGRGGGAGVGLARLGPGGCAAVEGQTSRERKEAPVVGRSGNPAGRWSDRNMAESKRGAPGT